MPLDVFRQDVFRQDVFRQDVFRQDVLDCKIRTLIICLEV
jgi:hypothetical protein